jgi:dTDP-4-amino-4,6-dideoxygalactose transaminase
MKVRLSKPSFAGREKLLAEFGEMLNDGYLVSGRRVREFEDLAAGYLGTPNAAAVSSGTAALHLALLALDIGPGDEVIVPAYTFPATANAVELTGARPVFADIDSKTFTIDPSRARMAVTGRTRAIMPVHLFGVPAPMDALMQLAHERSLAVIEDAAGALGSEILGRKCGTIGEAGCFSFHPRKVATTAEGGMVVARDQALAERVRMLRSHGMSFKDGVPNLILPGFNYRMNEMEAALGLEQVGRIEPLIQERRKLHERYRKLLEKVPGLAFQQTSQQCRCAWQSLVVRFDTIDSWTIIEHLRQRDIEATIGTYAVPLLGYYRDKYNFGPADFPKAAEIYEHAVALPFYNGLTEDEADYVAAVVRDLVESRHPGQGKR